MAGCPCPDGQPRAKTLRCSISTIKRLQQVEIGANRRPPGHPVPLNDPKRRHANIRMTINCNISPAFVQQMKAHAGLGMRPMPSASLSL